MATKEQIQEVKARTDIVEVVSRYVKLKRVGKSFAGLCPFHNEKTPSFYVNPQLGIFKCFGCGKAGDVITFLQEIEHVDFYEALSRLAKEVGVQLTGGRGEEDYKKVQKIKDVLAKVAKFYHFLLTKHKIGGKARAYTEKRGLTRELIDKFMIGYAPRQRDVVIKLANKTGVPKQILYEAGLLNDKGLDKFFDRLMFPVFDSAGNVVGFSGRVIDKDDTRVKYLNTPETPVFKKRFLLYGLFQAKDEIVKQRFALIMEGQMDAIASHKAGVFNAVAPMGTGLTTTQLTLLKRYAPAVVLAFDNDQAGQASIKRAAKLALEVGLDVYVVDIPQEYKDVDELVSDNPDAWKKAVANRQEFFAKEIRALKEILDHGQYQDFEARMSELFEILRSADSIKQEAVLRQISDELNIPIESLRESLNNAEKTLFAKQEDHRESFKPLDYFIGMLLNFPVLVYYVDKNHVHLYKCMEESYKEVFDTIKKFALEAIDIIRKNKKKLSVIELDEMFSKHFSEDYKLNVLEPLKLDSRTLDVILKLGFAFKNVDNALTTEIVEEFKDVYKRVLKACLIDQINQLQAQISQAELTGDEDTATILSKQMQDILVVLREIQ